MNSGIENPPSPEALPVPSFEVRLERSLEFAARVAPSFEGIGDEEAIFMLSLALDHPEWESELLKQVKDYKPHVQNPEALLERLRVGYQVQETNELESPQMTDAEWWNGHSPEAKTRIANLISYFRPTNDQVVSKVIIVPSDNLLPSKDTGRSFHVGDTIVIMSHTENLDNLEHEFLHSLINPLTEKFAVQIPEERVIALASNKLRVEEMYGDHALSLLNEELIRTYNDLIKERRPIRTFEDFKALINGLDDAQFTALVNAKPSTKIHLESMGISSLSDFKTRIQEYYDHYEKNELRERIYQLYQRFNVEKSSNPQMRFEDFFANEVSDIFK